MIETYSIVKGGPVLITPKLFGDSRGYFFESYNEAEFNEKVGEIKFVQDNESRSSYGVLRGLHYQTGAYQQAKLVRVVNGAVIDVAVDIRPDSPTYGMYFEAFLSGENHRQFFIPRGFAHGFLSLSNDTIFQYKCDSPYNKESEGAIHYADPDIGIMWNKWINFADIKLSEKDENNPFLREAKNINGVDIQD